MLRLKRVLYEETLQVRNLAQHGLVHLVGVIARTKRGRERMLGYCMLFHGRPIVHAYTWYVALSYTEPEDVRRKALRFLYSDDNLRLARVGFGVQQEDGMTAFDYLITYRGREAHHDDVGSSGAVATQTANVWRDGL